MRRPYLIGIGLVVLAAACLAAWFLSRTHGTTVAFVSTDPASGVEIVVGERVLGLTPLTTTLAPGRYVYVASAPGRRPATDELILTGEQNVCRVVVPPLDPLGGQILARCNAPAALFVRGQAAGTCNASGWTPLGHFTPGTYTVRAEMPLGTQEKEIAVYDAGDARVEFLWGSRVVVQVVTPAVTLPVTVTVDGRPYSTPVSFSADRLSSRPFAQVQVAAAGYATWARDVFLLPGRTVTVTAVLTPVQGVTQTVLPEILADYRAFWRVWDEAWRNLDPSHLPEVMTAGYLDTEIQAIEVIRSRGKVISMSLVPSPHQPSIEIHQDAARVAVSCTVTQTSRVKENDTVQTDHVFYQLDGAFLMQQGADGVWRVADWEGSWEEVKPGSIPTAGGGSPPAPPDREKIVQILVATVNCVRTEAGLPPVQYDPELAAIVQPFADEATAYAAAHHWLGGLPDDTAALEAAVRPYGGVVLAEAGLPLSFIPGNARDGIFAADWENYDGDPYSPCVIAKQWIYPELWLRPMSRLAIVLGPAVWFNPYYKTVFIAVAR